MTMMSFKRFFSPRGWLSSPLAAKLMCGAAWSMLALLSTCTLTVNHMWGNLVGRILWWFDFEAKRIARRNLEIAYPQHTSAQIDVLLKKSLRELGKTITELGPVWIWSRRRLESVIVKVEGREHVDAALSRGNGAILLSPHLGSWELMGLYLSMHYDMTSMYSPPKLTAVDGLMRSVRERFGAHLVPANLSGVTLLRRALANNGIIGILPDQDPGANGGVNVPFFGYSTKTMLLASRLAAKSNAPVMFAIAERLPKAQGFRLHFRPATERIASNVDTVAASALNEGVEECIRFTPTQYQWWYNRYKLSRAHLQTPIDHQQQRKAA